MGPRMILLLLFMLVIAVNIITLLIRKKKFLRLESMVCDLASSKGALTLKEISSMLGISFHDAKILMRKSVARGTTKEEIREGKKVYILQDNPD